MLDFTPPVWYTVGASSESQKAKQRGPKVAREDRKWVNGLGYASTEAQTLVLETHVSREIMNLAFGDEYERELKMGELMAGNDHARMGATAHDVGHIVEALRFAKENPGTFERFVQENRQKHVEAELAAIEAVPTK